MNMNMDRRGACCEEFIGTEQASNGFGAVAGFLDSRCLLACMAVKKYCFHVMEIQVCLCL